MIKIPVLDTIRSAYAFTFGQLGAIIGLIWIPQLIASVGGYFTSMPYISRIVAGDTPEQVMPEWALAAAGDFASLLLFAVMAVAVTRQALGLRKGPAIAYFSFGRPELRLFSALIALAAVAVIFTLAIFVAVLSLRMVAAPLGPAAASVAMLIGGGGLIYAMVRLIFLVVPSSVSNDDYGIERSWSMTRGNFWRIAAILLACLGPITVIALIAFAVIVGPDYFPADASILNDQAAFAKLQAAQMRIVAQNQPIMLGVAFALAPFTMGLWLGAASAVYKTLANKPDMSAFSNRGTSA